MPGNWWVSNAKFNTGDLNFNVDFNVVFQDLTGKN